MGQSDLQQVELPYIDAVISRMDEGDEPPSYLLHFHWGLFDDPADGDDSPERYALAGQAMTERILTAAGVADGHQVLDVGCGFGGTLDHIRARNRDCRLVGVNIDIRQLLHARDVLPQRDAALGAPLSFAAADGCHLPVAPCSVDRVLAVECIFHFPSRKAFFAEAARVLRPGGVLALSDFLVTPTADKTAEVWTGLARSVTESGDRWFGPNTRPLTLPGYERLARGTGFELVSDEDVTRRTLPTYPALRRIYREAGAADGVATMDKLEPLAAAGGWEYHVLTFRRGQEDLPGARGPVRG